MKNFVLVCSFIAASFHVMGQGVTNTVKLDWQEPENVRINGVYQEAVMFDGAEYYDSDLGLPSITVDIPFTISDSILFVEPVYRALDFFPFERKEYEFSKDTTFTTVEDSLIITIDSSYVPELVITIDSTYEDVQVMEVTDVVNEVYVNDTLFEASIIAPISNQIDTVDNVSFISDEFGTQNRLKVIPFIKRSDGSIEKLESFKYYYSEPRSSSFAAGNLYKIRITESGVYKIDKDFLKSIGVNVNSIDPRNIKIYGNGGGMLPQGNSDFRYNDVVENPIEVIGESDGVFNDNDFIIFYGKGQDETYYNEVDGRLAYDRNIYSDHTFYFLSVTGERGKRVEQSTVDAEPEVTFDYYDDLIFHEEDLNNLIISGREWVGERFTSSNNRKSYTFSSTGILPNTDVKVVSTLVSTPIEATSFSVTLEGGNLNTVVMPASVNGTYGDKAREVVDTITINSSGIVGSLNASYTYNYGSQGGNEAYMNRIEVFSKRSLAPIAFQGLIQVVDAKNYSTKGYTIQNSTGYRLWDVTNIHAIHEPTLTRSGAEASFVSDAEGVSKYVLFNTVSGFLEPVFSEVVEAQDLHGDMRSPDMIIVTPPLFESAALEYAALRNDQEGIVSTVVTTSEIYNEFASGSQDITAIRDYVRMVYHRSGGELKYLLLFGDASYDYKNRLTNNTNYVPTYEAYESYQNVNTYASDDFFGFMEYNEGSWVSNHTLDIGVGRFPIVSVEEAEVLTKKVEHYVSESSFGKWRSHVTFMADDDDNTMHMDQANQLAQKIEAKYPDYNTNKVFLDAFEQIATPSGKVSPDCASKLDERIEKGSLIVNYTGHGSEIQWTKEEVFNESTINKLRNFDRLSLFVTATCEFGRYDDPAQKSGAEQLLLNPNGGAIGMLTTTRPVYALSNFAINGVFYDKVFEPINDTLMPTLGQVIKMTKNNSFSGTRNRNFTLLGDPSMTLAYPEKKIAITQINDTISALGTTEIHGEVQYLNGSKMSDFSGEVAITVYDKESKIRTLGDEAYPFEFQSRENILYEGKASVDKGDFVISFVVPKDISYQFDEGKISLYASSTGSDAVGANTDIIIGGTDLTATLENKAPIIRAYIDTRSFVNGDVTDDSPLLISDIYDDNGINVSTSGLGHEMIAIIDGDESNAIILNEYYSSNLDSYQSGQINYQFKDLQEGKHRLTIRAWDTHNNVGETTIYFEVSYSNATVYAYPNPMTDMATFVIEHSREGEMMDVSFDLYSPQGELVMRQEESFLNSDRVIESMTWDGRDEFGVKLKQGVYYYRMTLRYPDDNFEVSKVNRLVLIN